MGAFSEKCIALRLQGHTLGEIVRITGRPKTSIYTHIRDLPLSPDRWRAIHESNGKHIRKFAIARKGKSLRGYRTFSDWNKGLVLLVAHLIFDGEIRRDGCCYNNRNGALVERVESLMKEIYEFQPRRYRNTLTGVVRIGYYNVALSAYIKEKAKDLLRHIASMHKDLKREFLRAFFDDEGCMDFRAVRNVRQIRGYQKVSISCF